MTAGEFARVLEQAGEPAPGPRPAGWDGAAMLARMREDLAALTAARAARWAAGAGTRRAARDLYERTCQQAGVTPVAVLPPWLRDEVPPCRIW